MAFFEKEFMSELWYLDEVSRENLSARKSDSRVTQAEALVKMYVVCSHQQQMGATLRPATCSQLCCLRLLHYIVTASLHSLQLHWYHYDNKARRFDASGVAAACFFAAMPAPTYATVCCVCGCL